MFILPNPLPEGGVGGIRTHVYLFPFMVSYKIKIFCMKIYGTIDIKRVCKIIKTTKQSVKLIYVDIYFVEDTILQI